MRKTVVEEGLRSKLSGFLNRNEPAAPGRSLRVLTNEGAANITNFIHALLRPFAPSAGEDE